MSRDLEPQETTTETAGGLDDAAIEPYAEWREACAAVDDAYCEWLCAWGDELPRAFAAYRVALEREESVAVSYGAVIDRLRPDVPSDPPDPSRPDGGQRSVGDELAGSRDQGLQVVIADRDAFARRALQRVLQEADEIATAAEARNGREAWELVCRHVPDVLLVDVGVPPSGAAELIRKVVSVAPAMRIVTLSPGTEWDQAVSAALRAGAVGHIDKDTAPDQIARLVVLVADGGTIAPGRLVTRPLSS